MVKPAAIRRAVGFLQAKYGLSARHACALLGLSCSTLAYRSRRQEPRALIERLKTLAAAHPGTGYRRLHELLRNEGFPVNHKRVYRLYRAEGLAKWTHARKRNARVDEVVPLTPLENWSLEATGEAIEQDAPAVVSATVRETVECVLREVVTRGVAVAGRRIILEGAIRDVGSPPRARRRSWISMGRSSAARFTRAA